MKLHILKIKRIYAYEKIKGNKLFEIRKNDRNFKVGDVIKYQIYDEEKEPKEANIIEKKKYKITYITNYEQKENYIVYGEKQIRYKKRKQNLHKKT